MSDDARTAKSSGEAIDLMAALQNSLTAARAARHVQFTDESGTWCSKDCPRPASECGAMAVRQNAGLS